MDNLSPFSETPSPFYWLEPLETTSSSFNSPNTNENDTVVPETHPLHDDQIRVDAAEAMFGVDFVPRITEEYTPYTIGGVPFKRRRRGCSKRLGSKESTLKAEWVEGMIKETASEPIEVAPGKPTVKKGNVRSKKDCSQNGKSSYGYASSPWKRASMEDFYETRIDGVDGEVVGLFGVFDGQLTWKSCASTHSTLWLLRDACCRRSFHHPHVATEMCSDVPSRYR